MAKKEYSQKIISNYYDNLDTIMLNKLSELTTELYLAQDSKKINALWQRAEKAMDKLKIPEKIKKNIIAKKDPKILAQNLNLWLKK
jgi:hypothetical protein